MGPDRRSSLEARERARAEAAEHRERFAEALRTIVGERLRPVYVLLDGEAPASEEPRELDEQEILDRLKSEFDAEEIAEAESS